ncbi:MAG TPA: helical backbone metal receptor [Longimicrobiaceae bacterium]|nr:helical backbone metal receptor [Longimicrobiaceae bacterium]
MSTLSLRRIGGGLLPPMLLALLAGCGGDAPRAAVPAAADSAVTVTDDAGRTVRLPRPARRVVSLLPAGTDALFALGAGDRVVGRTRYDELPQVQRLPSVGGGLDPSLEVLASLRPDLVLAFETAGGSRLRPRIEALGIPVYAILPEDTASILRMVRNLGHLVGRGAAADSLARGIRARIARVRAEAGGGEPLTALYVASVDPPIVAGPDTYIAELVGVAGGRLVGIPQGGARWPQISLEELVRLQPDVLVLPVGHDPGSNVENLRRATGWRELGAVREGRIATVPAGLMNRPGPSIGEAAEVLRRAIRSATEGRPR